MKACLHASGMCAGVLVMLAASAGMICNLVYLSIALDKESPDDSSCPRKIRRWTVGLLVWCVWCILTSASQKQQTSDDNDDAPAADVCIRGLVGLGTLGFAIAVPIVIDRDLRGVCPSTAYEEAFDVVFVYYVTLLGVLAVFACAGCIGFGVMAKRERTSSPVSADNLAAKL